ncbi:Phosphoenolpyruvate/pyruvate domain-containing protein [Polyporus arcularius HHB13444]|uniref:Phosphoenolpyruvate/pyruvate domain-containing protein n=1 Tax=Polyporus arcularius HHB13444 TaxID=1314778 RepID=A0A5C3PF10_9APHY|nr:Phosphoenolpyruvate/pyruvate domain-containing protein [Polyporus arcularius HHB13444]
MAALTHPLLHAFRASKPAFGAWLTLPGAFNARAAASASPHLSWVVIDCEHGMTSLHTGAGEVIAAIAGLGPDAPSALVRIPATGPCADGSAAWQIKYVLDQGARGIVVPMVSTRAQAASVVAAARFPPQGIRGFGNPFTQLAWGPGVSASDYLARANDAILVLVQIETRDGVQNLDDILSVDGLDGVFIGPYDLSLSLGFPPPSPDPHPEVEKTIQQILASAHAKNKKCAIYCISGTQAAKRAKEGFDMINVTSDSGAMADGLARHLSDAAGATEEKKGSGY